MKLYLLVLLVCVLISLGHQQSTAPTTTPTTSTFKNTAGTWQTTWKIDSTAQTITFTVTGKTTTGWVGMGLGTEMAPSDIYVGWLQADGTAVMTDRYATQYAMPLEDTAQGGTDDVTGVTGSLVNGEVQISFTRKMVTGDKYDTALSLGNVNILWAYGADGSVTNDAATGGTFNKHTDQGTATVNLATGASTDTTKPTSSPNLFSVHAGLMIVAVCCCFFPGMILARYFKLLFKKWFYVHAALQSVGMLFVFIGFIAIFVANNNVFTVGPHQVFGVLAFIGFLVEFAGGLLAHFKFDPNRTAVPIFPDKIHWFFGRFMVVWGLITVALGLITYGAPGGAWALFILWLVGCIAGLVVLQIKVGQTHENDVKPGLSDSAYDYQAADDEQLAEEIPKTTQKPILGRLPWYILGGIAGLSIVFILIGVVALLATAS